MSTQICMHASGWKWGFPSGSCHRRTRQMWQFMCGHPLLQAKNVKVKDIKLNQLEKWYGISGIQHRDGIQRLNRFLFWTGAIFSTGPQTTMHWWYVTCSGTVWNQSGWISHHMEDFAPSNGQANINHQWHKTGDSFVQHPEFKYPGDADRPDWASFHCLEHSVEGSGGTPSSAQIVRCAAVGLCAALPPQTGARAQPVLGENLRKNPPKSAHAIGCPAGSPSYGSSRGWDGEEPEMKAAMSPCAQALTMEEHKGTVVGKKIQPAG